MSVAHREMGLLVGFAQEAGATAAVTRRRKHWALEIRAAGRCTVLSVPSGIGQHRGLANMRSQIRRCVRSLQEVIQ